MQSEEISRSVRGRQRRERVVDLFRDEREVRVEREQVDVLDDLGCEFVIPRWSSCPSDSPLVADTRTMCGSCYVQQVDFWDDYRWSSWTSSKDQNMGGSAADFAFAAGGNRIIILPR